MIEIVNDFLNEPATSVDNVLNDTAVANQTSIGELYRRGRLKFHVHFRWCSRGELDCEQFCAIFTRFPVVGLRIENDSIGTAQSPSDFSHFDFLGYDNEQAVFVDNVQFGEQPQQSGIVRIRSLVRLKILDCCERLGSNEVGKPLGFGLKLRLGQAYREASFVSRSGNGRPFEQGELQYQMVKSRAKVVEAISEDERQGWIKGSKSIIRGAIQIRVLRPCL